MTCRECGGTGSKTQYGRRFGPAGTGVLVDVPCWLCKGTGGASVQAPLVGRRWNRSYAAHHAKLTVSDVLAIRRAARGATSVAALAARYGVGEATITDIVTYRSWTRLPAELRYWEASQPSAFSAWWVTIWLFVMLWRHQGTSLNEQEHCAVEL